MALTLPDNPNVGDTGHVPDTGMIIDALEALDAAKVEDLAVGTVTTGAPGSSAAASIAPGIGGVHTLDLTIPQGPTGATGPAGGVGPSGATGAAGPTGATGPQGPEGPEGQAGPTGPAGADGVDGLGPWVGPDAPIDPDYNLWIDTDEDPATAIPASVLDANTVLYATTDNTPAALAVAASTFVGRKATGNVAAMTAAESLAVLGVTVTRPSTDDVKVVVAGQTVHYDSGWRRIVAWNTSGTITAGTATWGTNWGGIAGVAGSLAVRRIGQMVYYAMAYVQAKADNPTAPVFNEWTTLIPAAFRPATGRVPIALTSGGVPLATMNMGDGTISQCANAGYTSVAQLMAQTDATLPSSLPGTLISAAPA